jgi:FAD/FMN-containing dehydrogenase
VSSLLADLHAIVGTDHVLVDADVRAAYERDWTGRYVGQALAVVRPADVEQVAAVLRWCSANGVGVVSQGGNTGLVGGGVPSRDRQIVLSTRRLTEVGPVDPAASQVTLGAGVTISQWRHVARQAGLDAPLDFGARESATIGGAIATDAGGSRVVRFGTMRSQVAGIQAVLADGSVVGSLAGLPKETAGLHWPSLLSGSEGTLGVITAARLRLVPWYAHTATAFVAVATLQDALGLLQRARQLAANLDSIEIIFPAALEMVAAYLGRSAPVTVATGRCAVIIECAAHRDPTDEVASVLDGASGLGDVAVATDADSRAKLTAYRDMVSESIAAESTRIGTPTYKLDVAVPVASLPDLLALAEAAAAADGCQLIPFGHLAEGNIHLNYVGAREPSQIAGRVLGAVAAMGGAISAEHGIGRAKAGSLHLIRSPGDLAAQRAIRRALDPAAILNAGVLDADLP